MKRLLMVKSSPSLRTANVPLTSCKIMLHRPFCYYVFDLMVIGGKDVMSEPLARRQQILEEKILPKLGEPLRQGIRSGRLVAKCSPEDKELPVVDTEICRPV
jgi:hypothetical protein